MKVQKKNHNNSFLLEAIRNIKTTGTVWPSSPHLIRKMLSTIKFEKADCIVEFGAGNGNITRELLAHMKPESRLLTFEINPTFYKQLKRELKDKRLTVIKASAEEIDTYLKKYEITKANYVVSGLPLTNLGKTFCETLLPKIYKALPRGGQFIQFQYSMSQYSLIKKYFKRVKIKFTALNIPPAVIYVCTK